MRLPNDKYHEPQAGDMLTLEDLDAARSAGGDFLDRALRWRFFGFQLQQIDRIPGLRRLSRILPVSKAPDHRMSGLRLQVLRGTLAYALR